MIVTIIILICTTWIPTPRPPYNAVAKSSPFFPGPLGRPAYYYCNCKEGNGEPTISPASGE